MMTGFLNSVFVAPAVATGKNLDYSLTGSEKLMIGIVFLVLLAFFLVVAWVIWRKFNQNSGAKMDSDFSILDRLTEEEARMVRDAMVRQTMQRKDTGQQQGATLAELERIAATGADAGSPLVATPPRPAGISPRPMEKPAPVKPAIPSPLQNPETEGIPRVALPEAPPWEQDDLSGEATLILDPKRSETGGGMGPRHEEETPGARSGGSIDLETLYRKGLIGREEYERLRALAERAQDE